MRSLELLAPAKNLACGIAAINHGADAVYIGAQRFGARAAAGNSIEDIHTLCQHAHQFSACVYVTVNTIIYDDELPVTQQLIQQLYDVGVDAILVQDMGILQMSIPPIALHASTQTDNRTVEKVRWLRDIGFRRVVLARELSVNEIREIHQQVPDVELEVFVHGALCVSYSGLCYVSQHCFQRSANRGECAQFCRMKFDLLDADGHELEHQRHLLSLKDLNQFHHLEELIEAGACSFKIEGRLKDATYVKNVVSAYSQRLDAIIAKHPDLYCRASQGRVRYAFTPNLKKTFNRGFTTYFLHGRQQDIFSPDTPKAMGEFVGTVKELRRDSFNVAGTVSFANGDGLCFINADHELEGFRVNRVQGNRLFPHQMPSNLKAGMALYRNYDQAFERQLARPTAERKIPISMCLTTTDDGFSLSCNDVSVSVSCKHETASKPQQENIQQQLSKLGDTIYTCTKVTYAPGFNFFIPNSVLSDLRRQLVERLDDVSSETHTRHAVPGGFVTESATVSHAPVSVPYYPHAYLYNISNSLSRDFYQAKEITAYEINGGEGPVMQCRHCLRYALGHCLKHHPNQLNEPLRLRLGDGRQFRLEFDCKKCQMNVYASN